MSSVQADAGRVILLGASNLAMNFSRVLGLVRGGIPGPLHVYAAFGHGRSYGRWSRVMHRSLPGISVCGLWDALGKSSSAGPTRALLIDVGNDLIYGASVEEISEWVEVCLQRLSAQNSDTILALLPMESLVRLSAWRYELTRRLFFPRNRSRWTDTFRQVGELNNQLSALAKRYGAKAIEQPGEWYGFDPIHIRQTRRATAWQQILSQWQDFNPPPRTRLSMSHRSQLWRARPAQRRVMGREQFAPQPSLVLDEVVVSMY